MIPSLDGLSTQVWQFCLDRDCEIESFHLQDTTITALIFISITFF